MAYSLLPLPTTPLFLVAGIARIRPLHTIPGSLRSSVLSWQSIAGLGASLLLLLALLFIDWRALIQRRKFTLVFTLFK